MPKDYFSDVPTTQKASQGTDYFADVPMPGSTGSGARGIDFSTGAPPGVRAAVGGVNEIEDKLNVLQQYYPDAFRGTGTDLYFTNPDTGLVTKYNETGLSLGDIASLTREGTQMAGGALGGTLGAALGNIPGAAVGSVLGTAAGEEAYQLASQMAGIEDPRTIGERATETAIAGAAGLGGPAGTGAGAAARAGARGMVRGGRQGRQRAQQAIEDLEPFGVSPSVAQASGREWVKGLENILSKTPGGAGIFRKRAADAADRVQAGIKARADKLAQGRADPEMAGKMVKRGIEEGFIPQFKDKSGALFSKLQQRMPAGTPTDVSNYRNMLEDLVAPIPGAEESSKAIHNPALRRYLDALEIDLGAQTGAGGELPFEAVMALRRAIGQKLTTTDLVADVSRGELKAAYRALSQDIEAAARAQGPEAIKAFKRANQYYKAGIERVDDFLEPLAKKVEPEKIFEALWSGSKQGPTKVRTVMRSLNPAQRKTVAAGFMERLGRAPASQQNAAGDQFSFETFLSGWSRLNDNAKDAVFGSKELKGMRQDLDRIANAAERMRETSRAFFNPSGTASAVTGIGMLAGLSGAAGASALYGDVAKAAYLSTIIAGIAAGANGGARLATNRGIVRWLATATKANPKGWGSHIGRLGAVAAASSIEDREAIRELLDFFDVPEQPAPTPQQPAPQPYQDTGATPVNAGG